MEGDNTTPGQGTSTPPETAPQAAAEATTQGTAQPTTPTPAGESLVDTQVTPQTAREELASTPPAKEENLVPAAKGAPGKKSKTLIYLVGVLILLGIVAVVMVYLT